MKRPLLHRQDPERHGRQPGQAIVEMALVTLLLLTLTFEIADVGLYMFDFVQTANCTREAARRAAVRKDPTNIPYCPSPNLAPTMRQSAGGAPDSDVTAS